MEYYPFDIGAYQRDTFDLKPLEHWAYRALIDQYYLIGGPLPNDEKILARMIGAIRPTEKSALHNVKNRFLTLNGDGRLHIARCDQELLIYQKRVDASRNAAAVRWQSERNAQAMPKERKIDRKKEGKPLDNSTCQHTNPNGQKCGQPGTHKLHPQSKDWFCKEHPEG